MRPGRAFSTSPSVDIAINQHNLIMSRRKTPTTTRARSLRVTATDTERLLWSVLRAKQLCNLKFRRQHPIGPYFVDFACLARRLVVEIDGRYHDATAKADQDRENYLTQNGWTVMRFAADDVEQDVEVVARALANRLGLTYEVRRRLGTGSGMKSIEAPKERDC